MLNLLRLLNPYIGYRAYVIGPLIVLLGTQFSSEKIITIAFVASGMLLMVTRPFADLGENKTNPNKQENDGI
ncbi:hypothetical protein [Vibrio crassostreae]|uniref:hypothetical protein n=1 Tax=Vibrio crassostreae TaxID=246167 RepID=UPI000A8FCD86|nr:hypothetical protein [Vibrio crassostreae]